MDQRVRAALIGCGGISKTHLLGLTGVGNVELVALADPRRDAAEQRRDEFAPRAAIHADAGEMLAAEQPELVIIATTAPPHPELTLAAVEAGARWVMCEKPIACSLRAARQMIDACERAGVRLAINHLRRWAPPLQQLRDALADGVIGRPRSFFVSLGAGRLGCNGCHMVDFVRMLTGQDVESVTGWLDTTGTPNPRGPEFWDPGAHALIHLADGTRVFLDQMEDLGVPPEMQIVGSIGRLSAVGSEGSVSVRARRDADQDKPMMAYGCPLEPVAFEPRGVGRTNEGWHQVQALAYRNLLADEPVLCSGEDGYRAVEAVLAVHLSDQRGHVPVALPLDDDDLDFEVRFT